MLPESVFIVEGSHVFVVYRLADGREWIVDNEMSHPKLVPTDASPIQLVFLLSVIRNLARLKYSYRRA